MARAPVTGLLSQYAKNAGGASASDFWLKFYNVNTTTQKIMFTSLTGGSALSKCTLNTRGEPISNQSDDDSTFIPYVDGGYDAYLFESEADADANNTAAATFLGRVELPELDLTEFGLVQFADVSSMKLATALNVSESVNFADILGQKVSTVVNNTISNKGGKDYIITNINPGNLSTLVGGVWVGVNHDLGGGFYAKLDFDGELNVLNVGASGVEAVDSIAFNAAMNASLSVFAPAFNYRVNDTVYYRSNQIFRGEGNATNIISTVSGGSVFENNSQVFDFRLSKFVISCGGDETSGIRCTGTFEGFHLDNLKILRCGDKAIWLTDCFVGTVINVISQGGFVQDWGLFLEGCTNINFYGCRFRESSKLGGGVGIKRGPSGASYDMNFYGCLFESNAGPGVRAEGVFGLLIDGGYFEGNNRELDFSANPTTRFAHVELTTISTGAACSKVRINPNYFNGARVAYLVYSDIEVSDLQIGGKVDQLWLTYPFQIKRYAVDLSNPNSSVNLVGDNIDSMKIGVQSATFIARDAENMGDTYSINLVDTDNIVIEAEFISVTGSESADTIVSNLVSDLSAAVGVSITNNANGSFTVETSSNGIWDFNNINNLANYYEDSSGRFTSQDAVNSSQSNIQLFYYNSSASQVEGLIKCNVTTRTSISNNIKTSVFSISNIDVSNLITEGLSSRAVGIMPNVGRFSRGFFSGLLNHSGESAGGVLQFSIRSRSDVSKDLRLLKDRSSASSSNIARISDLDGVSSLDGSITYF